MNLAEGRPAYQVSTLNVRGPQLAVGKQTSYVTMGPGE